MWVFAPYPGPVRGFGPAAWPQNACSAPSNPLLAWWYPTSAVSILPRKCRFPDQGPPSALAHMCGGPGNLFSWYTSL